MDRELTATPSFVHIPFKCHNPTHSSSGVPFIHCDCVAIHTFLFIRRPIHLLFMCRNPHINVIRRPVHSSLTLSYIVHTTRRSHSIVHTLQSSVAHPSHSFSLHASHSRIVHTSRPSVVHASQSFSRSCISLAAWSLLDLVFSLA